MKPATIKIELTRAKSKIDIEGVGTEVLATMCTALEMYPELKDLFKTSIAAHDGWVKAGKPGYDEKKYNTQK